RTVIDRPPSAIKAVGLNQVEKLWRLTFVSTRARIWSQMLVSMQDHLKNRERGTFAHTKGPPLQAFRDFLVARRRENPVAPTFACAKSLEIDAFLGQLSSPSMFSTVFSTVVEILGNKPKGRSESDA